MARLQYHLFFQFMIHLSIPARTQGEMNTESIKVKNLMKGM